MEAPDKIYVPQNIIEARHIQELSKPVVAGSTEYIRKETILELVKDLKHIYEIPISNHQLSRLRRIKAKTLQIVIEKIESL